jgi:hypothetical protein
MSLMINQKIGDKVGEAHLLFRLGITCLAVKKIEEGKSYLNKAKELNDQLKDDKLTRMLEEFFTK